MIGMSLINNFMCDDDYDLARASPIMDF